MNVIDKNYDDSQKVDDEMLAPKSLVYKMAQIIFDRGNKDTQHRGRSYWYHFHRLNWRIKKSGTGNKELHHLLCSSFHECGFIYSFIHLVAH